MRFNKDFIAETLAASSHGATDERWLDRETAKADPRPASPQAAQSGKAAAAPMNVSRIREQKQRVTVGSALVWLALFFVWPAAAPAQTSLPTAERPALHLLPAKRAALRPASAAVASVDAVALTVADAEAEAAFFSRVLSFEKVADVEVGGDDYEHLEGVFGLRMRVVRMRLGDEFIELVEYLAPRGRPIPVESRSNDRWFQHIAIITSDMERAYEWLRKNKVEHASSGPQRLPDWNPNAGGIRAFYFKDPEGHVLETLQFPAGKGDAKWHQPSGRLFLGIDHTAIVVADTDASLAFYRDALGMRVAGASENYGTEQEHLNNVFGARLRITALRAQRGPGIELLEYLAPRDGKPYPPETRANDLWHWQTRLIVTNAEQASRALTERRIRFVSSGVVALAAAEQASVKSFVVRDPDGHAIQLIER